MLLHVLLGDSSRFGLGSLIKYIPEYLCHALDHSLHHFVFLQLELRLPVSYASSSCQTIIYLRLLMLPVLLQSHDAPYTHVRVCLLPILPLQVAEEVWSGLPEPIGVAVAVVPAGSG